MPKMNIQCETERIAGKCEKYIAKWIGWEQTNGVFSVFGNRQHRATTFESVGAQQFHQSATETMYKHTLTRSSSSSIRYTHLHTFSDPHTYPEHDRERPSLTNLSDL